MKDVIRVQVERNGEIANYKTEIDGSDSDIAGAIVCILGVLMDDGKHDLITKALEMSRQDIFLDN